MKKKNVKFCVNINVLSSFCLSQRERGAKLKEIAYRLRRQNKQFRRKYIHQEFGLVAKYRRRQRGF